MNARIALMLVLLAASFLAQAAHGSPAVPPTRAELKARFEARHQELNALKVQGTIGETWQGFVEAVKDPSDLVSEARTLVEQENADRRSLYELIANDVVKGEKRISPEKVAERNARRNFANAKPNEFLKTRDGLWMQRKEIAVLKQEGKVGETSTGYVEAVPDAGLNQRQRVLVEEENRIRKEIYERQAEKRGASVEIEAQRAGRQNIDTARPGEYIREADGPWQRKQ